MPSRSLGLLVLLVCALPAQAAMRWHQVGSAQSPPARVGAAFAQMASGTSTLFSGCRVTNCNGGSGDLLDDQWAWDGAAWSQVPLPAAHPQPRWGAVFANDRAGKALLFGGQNVRILQDTWIWNGSAWTSKDLSLAASPPALWVATMAPGPTAGELFLWGGRQDDNAFNASMFWWTGTYWTVLGSDRSLTGLMDAALAFDASRSTFVLYGGLDGLESDQFLTGSCTGSGCHWSDRTRDAPGKRSGHAIVYDSDRHVLVLFGGVVDNVYEQTTDDTWEYDGIRWRAIAPPVAPSARTRHAMVYDPVHRQVVLFGGSDGASALGDTWVYEDDGASSEHPDAGVGGGTVDAGSPGNQGADAGTSDGPGRRGEEPTSVYGCTTASLGAPLLVVALLLLARRRRTLLVILLALGAANARAETGTRPRLAFLGLQATSAPRSEVDSLGEFVQSEAAALGAWDVVGLREIDTLLGLEQKKQLLGCEDDTGCLAEIGGMLGVERTLSGSVSRLGDTLMVNLWLLDARKARVVARVGRRIKAPGSNEPALDLVPSMLEELARADGAFATPARTWTVGLRGENDLTSTGGLGALRVGVDGQYLGAAVSLLAPALGGRLEGLVHPLTLGAVRPYAALGATLVRGLPLARGALGVEVSIGKVRVQVDLAKEVLLSSETGLTNPLLVGAGIGWAL